MTPLSSNSHARCRERTDAPFRRARAALAFFAVWMLAGCGGGEADDIACTAEARPAVELSFVDAAGVPVTAVTIRFQVDGGAAEAFTCDSGVACAFGHEKAGAYAITVNRAGYLTDALALTVGRDVCHVITERRTLTLRPAG